MRPNNAHITLRVTLFVPFIALAFATAVAPQPESDLRLTRYRAPASSPLAAVASGLKERVLAPRRAPAERPRFRASGSPARGFAPRSGAPVFRLRIPRIRLNERVVEGVTQSALARGPGHYPSCRAGVRPPFCTRWRSAWPGERGRVVIGAHRTIAPRPFFHLGRMRAGDAIEIFTRWGNFRYRVTGTRVVGAADRSIVVPGSRKRELVLVTCHPKFSSAQRLLVFARLVPPRG